MCKKVYRLQVCVCLFTRQAEHVLCFCGAWAKASVAGALSSLSPKPICVHYHLSSS